MSIVPSTRIGRLEFYEAHIKAWQDNASAIGLSAGQTTQLATLILAAREAYLTAETARDVSKSATESFYFAVSQMHDLGADLIDLIKTKARMTGDNSIYGLANIPGPVDPTPVGPPGTPFDFTAQILQNGAMVIKWKCGNPANGPGVMYEVARRTGATGSFNFVGAVGRREIIDTTVPVGTTTVTYQITGIRSTTRGFPAQFNVNFGFVGGVGAVGSAPMSAGLDTPTPNIPTVMATRAA